jgi:phage recombination protein Bet
MTKEVTFLANGEEVKLTGATVKNYLTRGDADVTDQEVVMFINLCKYQKLNPFLNEAYLVKFKSKNGNPSQAQLITSKEAYMKRAEAQEEFNGFEAGVIVLRNNEIVEMEGSFTIQGDKLVGGWAKVYRKDRDHPVVSKVSMGEYSTGKSTWNSMPATMIRKVAIVNALREAFPAALGAMYTEDDKQEPVAQETPQERAKREANSEPLNIKREAVDAEVVQEEPDDVDMSGTPFEEAGF